MDVRVVLSAVNTELRERWQLERRLAGGWNEGAYLLSRAVQGMVRALEQVLALAGA
jgi:hypothetical protein